MSDKGRGRTSRYLYVVRPVEVSFDPGGLASASWVTPGGTSRGLVNGSSTNKGLCLLVGETCTWRLAPGTTWVAFPTINLVRALLAPMLRDARGRLPMIRRLGDDAYLKRDDPHSPIVPDIYRPSGDFVVVLPGDASMVDLFGRAPIASPPAPSLRTSAAAARPILRAPHNMRSNGTLRRSSAGARFPFPFFVGILCSSAMADDTAGTALLFAAA